MRTSSWGGAGVPNDAWRGVASRQRSRDTTRGQRGATFSTKVACLLAMSIPDAFTVTVAAPVVAVAVATRVTWNWLVDVDVTVGPVTPLGRPVRVMNTTPTYDVRVMPTVR